MRLTPKEIEIITTTLLSYSNSGEIYLHGSRLDNNKKGGDIDLFFVIPDQDFSKISNQKFTISAEVSLKLNEQKVDIIYLSNSDKSGHHFFNNSQKTKISS